MTGATMFTGIRAPEVAAPQIDWKFCAEIEPFPCAVIRHYAPEVPNLGDVTADDFIERARTYGPIDVLVAGPPCQDFSVAGLRAGMDGSRGSLSLRFLEVVDGLRPSGLVIENVPGLLSSNEGRDFGALLGRLGQLGYGFAYRILDAQFFGVPQRRRRVFIVGCLGDWRRAAAVLFERHSLSGDSAPSRKAGQGFAHELAPSLTSSGRGVERPGESRGQDPVVAVCPTLRAGGNRTGGDRPPGTDVDTCDSLIVSHAPSLAMCLNAGANRRIDGESETFTAHALRAEGFDASEDGTGRGTPLVPIAFSCKDHGADAGDISPTLRSMGHAGSHANAGGQVSVAHTICLGSDPIFDRELAMPLTRRNGDPGVVQTAMAVRRLTPRECERLQGFPDDYTGIPYRGKPAADGPRYKALGNSMAVPVMRWILNRYQAVHAMEATA